MDYKNCKIFFLLCFLISWKSALFCQVDKNIKFTNISNSDIFPNNSVNAITKDDLGFIWIGTNDGLCRYEGPNSIKVYAVDNPKIEGGIESSNIRSLFLDSKNNLWIGTRLGGLTKFHQPSNTWKTFRNEASDSTSLCNDEILTITEDSKGRIWVGTEDGLSIYNHATESFFSFKVDKNKPGSLKAKAILSIFEDDKGWMWVGTWEGGLNLLVVPENGNIEQGEFRTFYPTEKNQSWRIWEIYQDNQNRYWIGTTGGGLFLMEVPFEAYNNKGGLNWTPHFHNYFNEGVSNSLSHDDLKKILQDRNGNLWIATLNGLNCILADELKKLPSKGISSDKVKLNFYQYFDDFGNPSSLINNNVRTLFEDDQGIIWAGTHGGVSQYNWATNQFDVHELGDAITKNPISQNLYIDQEGIAWIGNGEKGILKYDFVNRKKYNEEDIGANLEFVSSLYSPDDRSLYIGHSKGISVLEIKTKKIKHFPIFELNKQQKNYSFIRSIFKDHLNRIWIGTLNGLFVIDEKTGSYKVYLRELNNTKSISDNTVNQIFEDSNGDIWLTTFQGLNKVIQIKPDEFEFERFKHDPKNPQNSIPSNRIVSITEINKTLYIASTNGLSGYNLIKKSFTNYSKENNKYSYTSIVKTEDDNIWGTTTEGIVLYNTQSNTFNKYNNRDGLTDLVFCLRSKFKDKNGWIYFGSHSGITRFDPLSIVNNERPPPVHITDIRVMSPEGEVIDNGTYSKEIVLEHNEYYLSLDYAAVNYNRAEKNKYAFMLEGFDDKWNFLDKKRPAIYTNLKHGTYHFKVKAANNDGVWNEIGNTIKIIKKPAYWETWWFIIGCILGAILLVIVGVQYYTKSVNEINKKLQTYNQELNNEIAQRKLVESDLQQQKLHLGELNVNLERSNKDLEQFAYIASHDLQEPLRVVGGFISLLKRRYEKHFDEDAFEYLDFAIDGVSRMSEQIKSILTFSKVSQNEINIQFVKLDEVIANNLHDLSENIKEKNVQFSIDELPEIFCDKNLIVMVFHNLINNAIKFNKSTKPLITISYHPKSKEGFWQFSIKDNGIGIHEDYQFKIFEIFKRLHSKKDYEGTGIGLALCKKIINRHGGDIWVESKEDVGTTFYFTIKKTPIPKMDKEKPILNYSNQN